MMQPHIRIDESMAAPYALLPGDPARIDRIAPFLSDVRELAFNREYRSISGTYKNIRVLVVSTGIGGWSAGIAMIRIGSCGAMQPGIRLGDLILAAGAVRDDGASQAYVDLRYPAVADTGLLHACLTSARENHFPCHIGIVHSHESFYIDDNEEQKQFWAKKGVLCADMETAALFTIGRLRRIKTASILNNVVISGTDTADGIGGYVDGGQAAAQGEKHEILTALEAFVISEKGKP